MTDWSRRNWIATAAGVAGLSNIEDLTLAFDRNAFGLNAAAIRAPQHRAAKSK